MTGERIVVTKRQVMRANGNPVVETSIQDVELVDQDGETVHGAASEELADKAHRELGLNIENHGIPVEG